MSRGVLADTSRQFRLVTLYRIISRAYFHLPLVAIFLTSHGFPLIRVAFILALYGVVAAFADAFVRPLKRRLSLAGSLVLGELVKITGLLWIVLDVSPAAVVGSQVLAGVGFSLTAGTDGALASSLRGNGDVRRQESSTQAGMFIASFGAAVLGAASMAAWDRLPFVLSAGASAVALLTVLSSRLPLLSSTTIDRTGARASDGRSRGPLPARARFWALYYSLNRALLLSAYTLVIPLLLFSQQDVSLLLFGILMGLYTLLGLVAARVSARLAGSPLLFALSSGGLVAGIAFLTGGTATFVALALATLGITGGFVRPATMISLEPALSGASATQREKILRGLERNQGVLQATVLCATGICLSVVDDFRLVVFGYLVACILLQMLAGAMFFSTRGSRATNFTP